VTVEIRTADEVLALEEAAGWAARRAQRDDPVLRAIWRLFAEHGGPVAREQVIATLPDLTPDAIDGRMTALDAADLVGLGAGGVRLAYPFTADPNDFEVVLPGGRSRYACCAIDALGVAPMLDVAVTVKSRCRGSGAALVFGVDPVAGPREAPPGSLVWVERGGQGGDRLSGFL
jgi:hypothetical protein